MAALDSLQRHRQPTVEETAQASFGLPLELQRVLRLPTDLRQCFVLRLLVAMSREFCARVLGLDVAAFDHKVCLAAQTLCLCYSRRKNS